MEQSYGKVLARGKYVHEIVLHRVKPDKVNGYVELIGEEYPRIAEDKQNNVHLVGSWKVEIGEADTFGGCFFFFALMLETQLSALTNYNSPHLGV